MATNKVVRFKDDKGVSNHLLDRLLAKSRKYGLNEVIPIGVEKILVAEWVHLKCRYGCAKYNTNRRCPPATPNPDKVRKVLDEYQLALLLVGSAKCPDFYRDNKRKRAMQVRLSLPTGKTTFGGIVFHRCHRNPEKCGNRDGGGWKRRRRFQLLRHYPPGMRGFVTTTC